jgi:SAM-dependent methyltransferase
MGRFATTADIYLKYRQPYPPAFFAEVARRLDLGGRERLIDFGTGPGVIALGFAPYVASVTGVDPEPAMLAEARANAERAMVHFDLHAGRAEDLDPALGPFDLVTIGRALHWMDPDPTRAVIDRITTESARVLVCGSRSAKEGENPWLDAFDNARKTWAPVEEDRHRIDYDAWFAPIGFLPVDRILVRATQEIDIDHLFARALTLSSTSRAILGDTVDARRADLEAALAPFFADGPQVETVDVMASVFARPAG